MFDLNHPSRTISVDHFDFIHLPDRSGADNRERLEIYRKFLVKAIPICLTRRQREIVVLYYFEGLNQTQIASLLDIHHCSVSRTLKTAKMRLRQFADILEKLGYFSSLER